MTNGISCEFSAPDSYKRHLVFVVWTVLVVLSKPTLQDKVLNIVSRAILKRHRWPPRGWDLGSRDILSERHPHFENLMPFNILNWKYRRMLVPVQAESTPFCFEPL